MTTKKIAIAAAAALALAAGSVWMVRDPEAPPQATASLAEEPAPAVARAPEAAAPEVGSDPIPNDGPSGGEPAALEPPQVPAVVVRVVDQDGEPVAGAVLEARWYAEPSGAGMLISSERPEPSPAGEFALQERRGASVFLVAEAPLHVADNRLIEVPEEGVTEPVELELEYGGVLDFRLVAPLEGDRPVAGATIGYLSGPHRQLGSLGLPPPDFDARAAVERIHEVTSDAAGDFSIGYAAGTLWITAEGFGPTAVTIYQDALRGSSQRRSISLYPPTVLAIDVARRDGAPVPEFRYELARILPGTPGRDLAFRRVAAGDRVEHHLLHECVLEPHGRMIDEVGLGVSAEGLVARRRVPIEPGAVNEVVIRLEAAGVRISGRVLTEGGIPVADARVMAVSGEQRQAIYDDRIARRSESARSSPDGRYELVLPAETPSATLVVDGADHPLHISERLVLRRDGLVEHDVVLSRPATLRVRLAARVKERAGDKVRLTNESMECYPMLEYQRKVSFGPDGAAVFERVHAAPWVLEWTEESIIRRQPITVAPGRVHEVVLGELDEDAPRVHARGWLLSRTRAVDGIVLWLMDGAGAGLLAQATTGAGGAFAFDDVPAGRHSLGIAFGQRLADLPLRYASVEVDLAGTPIVADVTTCALRGRVLSAAGPLGGVRVRAWSRQWIQGLERWASFASSETDAEGMFVLEGVYEVPAVIAFDKDGYVPRRRRWSPDGAAESLLGDTLLDDAASGGGLSFRLLDADSGERLRSGYIDVAAIEDGVGLPVTMLRAGEAGAPLATGPLAPGRYRVTARGGDAGVLQYGMRVLEVEHDGSPRDLEVRCKRGASVSLILDSDSGVVPRRATVEVRDLNGAVLPAWNGAPSLVLSGAALLAGLPFEGVTVRVSARGWRTAEFPLRPVPGRVARITRRLEREGR